MRKPEAYVCKTSISLLLQLFLINVAVQLRGVFSGLQYDMPIGRVFHHWGHDALITKQDM